MTARSARLRIVPTIAFEPEEGSRLRRAAGEAGRTKEAGGQRPRQPWREDIYDLQMRAKIAVTLVDEVFRNIKALEELHQISLYDHTGFAELCFQTHQVAEAAAALQSN